MSCVGLRIAPILAVVALLGVATRVGADTGSSLGDKTGEGTTAFTGLAQSPEANLFTGALTTSIPIELPPGRKNMTPKLALEYSSAAGPSAYGYGWSLPIGQIERTTKWGVPNCDNPHFDEFVLMMPGAGASELVQTTTSNVYRPRVEQAYAEATFNSGGNYWTVRDRAGMEYTFGDPINSTEGRISSQGEGLCGFTSVWGLTKIEDPNGNLVEIHWVDTAVNGNQLLPDKISYGGHNSLPHFYFVDFGWASNDPANPPPGPNEPPLPDIPESPVSFRRGVMQQIRTRLTGITVSTSIGSNSLIRVYQIATGPVGEARSSIASASIVGQNETIQLFVYSDWEGLLGHESEGETSIMVPVGFDKIREWSGVGDVRRTLLDMTGDGILDLVYGEDFPWEVYPGFVDLGAGPSFGFESAAIPWSGIPGIPSYEDQVREVDLTGSEIRTKWDTLDIDGDGIPDFVDARSTSGNTDWIVYRGRNVGGSWGFDPTGDPWVSPARYIRIVDVSGAPLLGGATVQDLIDFTGDGLPDLIASDSSGDWLVYRNTGNGFDTQAMAVPRPDSTNLSDLLDFNGDGLPDAVRQYFASQFPNPTAYAGFRVGFLGVFFNNGQGFDPDPVIMPVPNGASAIPGESTIHDWVHTTNDLIDINGDGLPDLVMDRYEGQPWSVLLNLGGRLEPVAYRVSPNPNQMEAYSTRLWSGVIGDIRTTFNSGGNSNGQTVDMIDLNGDGMLDRITAGAGSWGVQLNLQGTKPSLLTMMQNGVGGTNTIRYEPSSHFDNTGGDNVADMPFLNWLVTGTRLNDGQCVPGPNVDVFDKSANPCIGAGNERITTVRYQDGLFAYEADGANNIVDREFRGFGLVTQTDIFDNDTQTVFDQGPNTAGLVDSVTYFAGSAGSMVRTEYNVWQEAPIAGGRVKVWLEENVRTQWDGGSVPLTLRSHNDAVDEYGNATISWKEGTNVPHRVYIETAYAPPGPDAPRDRPQSTFSWEDRNGNGSFDANELLEQKKFQYDGLAGGVLFGNATQVQSHLINDTEDRWVVTTNHFDLYGNIDLVSGAGRITSTDYNHFDDGTFLYPTLVTEAMGALDFKTETAFDYRYGKPISRRGPNELANGTAYLFDYDSAGRIFKEAAPGDTLSDPTVQYDYSFPSLQGPGPWALSRVGVGRKQPAGGSIPRLWSWTYNDALGRQRYVETKRVVDGGTLVDVRSNRVEFDAGGNVERRYLPYDIAGGAGGWASFEYNLNGSPTITDPFGRVRKVINPDGTTIITSYAGPVTSVVGLAGDLTKTHADAFGRDWRTESFDENFAMYSASESLYDGLGRMLAMYLNCGSFPNFGCSGYDLPVVLNTYDTLSRKIQTWHRDSGTWRYGYDDVGNLIWQEDPKVNQHMEYCYDEANRPTLKCSFPSDYSGTAMACGAAATCPAGEISARYEYDDPAVPNSLGRATRVVDNSGELRVEGYDTRGRQTGVTRQIVADGETGEATTLFEYNEIDQVTKVTYPDGEIVETTYDDTNQPIYLSSSNELFYVSSASYDILGRPKDVTKGNGTTDTVTYYDSTENNRVDTVAFQLGSSLRHSQKYTYNDRGQIATVDHIGGSSGGADDNGGTYAYDPYGRLTGFTPDSAALQPRTYTYDALGNMTNKAGVAMTYPAYPGAPHQVQSVKIGSTTWNPQHDANGNRGAVFGTGTLNGSASYDPEDRLSQVDLASGEAVYFHYDAGGQQRVKLVESALGATTSVTRYYTPQVEVTEDASTSTTIKSYYFGGRRVASQVVPGASWQSSPLAALSSADPIQLAAQWAGRPVLIVGLSSSAQSVAAVAISALFVALFLLPAGRRRRAVAGLRLSRGSAVGITLLFVAGTIPGPILLQPAQAQCTGCGCPTPTPVPGSVLRYFHYDHLGSPLMITDSGGAVVEQIRYQPYGEVRGRFDANDQPIAEPAPDDVRYEFTGYEAERNTGLLYANARYYDPVLGSFLTHDPAAQYWSPYTYTGWDPVNVVDPSGAFGIEEFIVAFLIGFAVGVGVAASDGARGVDLLKAGLIAGAIAAVSASILGPIGSAASKAGAGSLQFWAFYGGTIGTGTYGTVEAFKSGNQVAGVLGVIGLALAFYSVGKGISASQGAQPSEAGGGVLDYRDVTGRGVGGFGECATVCGRPLTAEESGLPIEELVAKARMGGFYDGIQEDPFVEIIVGLGARALTGSVSEVLGNRIGSAAARRSASRGLEKQLDSHLKKLKAFEANPDMFDNKGFLKGASPELRQKIIGGRIRNLEKQIENFRNQINRMGGGG